eukprot:6187643-Pleurochrysis_carterae.AAC.2
MPDACPSSRSSFEWTLLDRPADQSTCFIRDGTLITSIYGLARLAYTHTSQVSKLHVEVFKMHQHPTGAHGRARTSTRLAPACRASADLLSCRACAQTGQRVRRRLRVMPLCTRRHAHTQAKSHEQAMRAFTCR